MLAHVVYNIGISMVKRKVFLPKWQRFYIVPLMLGIWLFVTYLEFFGVDESDKMGLIGYLFMSGIFIGVSVMMWLMTSGKLPAYVIEETKEDIKKKKK